MPVQIWPLKTPSAARERTSAHGAGDFEKNAAHFLGSAELKFRLIADQRETFPVRVMCDVMGDLRRESGGSLYWGQPARARRQTPTKARAEAVRRTIQNSQASLRMLARRYGINPTRLSPNGGSARPSPISRPGPKTQSRRCCPSRTRRLSSPFGGILSCSSPFHSEDLSFKLKWTGDPSSPVPLTNPPPTPP